MAYFNIHDIFQKCLQHSNLSKSLCLDRKKNNTPLRCIRLLSCETIKTIIGSLVTHSDTDDVTSVIDGQRYHDSIVVDLLSKK